MNQSIPLSVPNLKGKELEYITEAIESEWVSTAGLYITKFEKELAKYVGAIDGVACQSGTAGLHLALLALGVKPGEEVIVPTLTFVAAVNPVKYIGAEPVCLHCDDGLTMDGVKLERFCEEECQFDEGVLIHCKTQKKITTIVVVHVFGNTADMEKIMNVAQKYNLHVIEDATEALGTYWTDGLYKGKYAGTIGDIGVYSFNGNKIITTGGGGMIVSNDKNHLDYCRYLSTQAKDDLIYFDHNEVGYNYRMTNVQASIGLAQLEQLEEFIQTKERNYKCYKRLGIDLMEFRNNIRPNYWFYSYTTRDRDRLLQYLDDKKIQTRPIWKLIHMLKPYGNSQSYQIEKAVYYYNHILNLPCSSNLTQDEVKTVSEAIQSFK